MSVLMVESFNLKRDWTAAKFIINERFVNGRTRQDKREYFHFKNFLVKKNYVEEIMSGKTRSGFINQDLKN